MLVTPYLPNDAMVIARGWARDHNKPVFVLAFDHCTDPLLHIPACPNCAGVGRVFLRFANGGPYSKVTSSNIVVTWYDGDGKWGKGWYTIERTDGFICPECKGRINDPGLAAPPRIDITAMLDGIGKKR